LPSQQKYTKRRHNEYTIRRDVEYAERRHNEYTERRDVEYAERRIGNQALLAQTGWVGFAVLF
jgi:hypothetical protein